MYRSENRKELHNKTQRYLKLQSKKHMPREKLHVCEKINIMCNRNGGENWGGTRDTLIAA